MFVFLSSVSFFSLSNDYLNYNLKTKQFDYDFSQIEQAFKAKSSKALTKVKFVQSSKTQWFLAQLQQDVSIQPEPIQLQPNTAIYYTFSACSLPRCSAFQAKFINYFQSAVPNKLIDAAHLSTTVKNEQMLCNLTSNDCDSSQLSSFEIDKFPYEMKLEVVKDEYGLQAFWVLTKANKVIAIQDAFVAGRVSQRAFNTIAKQLVDSISKRIDQGE